MSSKAALPLDISASVSVSCSTLEGNIFEMSGWLASVSSLTLLPALAQDWIQSSPVQSQSIPAICMYGSMGTVWVLVNWLVKLLN